MNASLDYQLEKSFFARAGISTATAAYFAAVGFKREAIRVDIAAAYQAPLGISPGILLLFNLTKIKPASPNPAVSPE